MDNALEAERDEVAGSCSHLLIWSFHLGSYYKCMGNVSEGVETVLTQLLCKMLSSFLIIKNCVKEEIAGSLEQGSQTQTPSRSRKVSETMRWGEKPAHSGRKVCWPCPPQWHSPLRLQMLVGEAT